MDFQPELEPADEQLVREWEPRALPFAHDGGADQPHGLAAVRRAAVPGAATGLAAKLVFWAVLG